MMLQSRGAGRYGYVIGRPDLEEWGEPSLETFATMAEADEAAPSHENSGSPKLIAHPSCFGGSFSPRGPLGIFRFPPLAQNVAVQPPSDDLGWS
jgi:hypothetical protein